MKEITGWIQQFLNGVCILLLFCLWLKLNLLKSVGWKSISH